MVHVQKATSPSCELAQEEASEGQLHKEVLVECLKGGREAGREGGGEGGGEGGREGERGMGMNECNWIKRRQIIIIA